MPTPWKSFLCGVMKGFGEGLMKVFSDGSAFIERMEKEIKGVCEKLFSRLTMEEVE